MPNYWPVPPSRGEHEWRHRPLTLLAVLHLSGKGGRRCPVPWTRYAHGQVGHQGGVPPRACPPRRPPPARVGVAGAPLRRRHAAIWSSVRPKNLYGSGWRPRVNRPSQGCGIRRPLPRRFHRPGAAGNAHLFPGAGHGPSDMCGPRGAPRHGQTRRPNSMPDVPRHRDRYHDGYPAAASGKTPGTIRTYLAAVPRAATTFVTASPPAATEWCTQRPGWEWARGAQDTPADYPAHLATSAVQLGGGVQAPRPWWRHAVGGCGDLFFRGLPGRRINRPVPGGVRSKGPLGVGGRNTWRWPAPCLGPHISKAIEDRPIRPRRSCLRRRHGRRPLPGIGTDGVRVFTWRSTGSLLPFYSGHSFRIGAATTAAERGVQDSTIQALGRWSRSVFLLYVRTPPARLAQLSWTLAGVPGR